MDGDYYFTKVTGEKVILSDIEDGIDGDYEQASMEGLQKVTDRTPGSQSRHVIHNQAEIEFDQKNEISDSEYNSNIFHMKGQRLDDEGYKHGVYREGAEPSNVVVVFTIDHEAEEDIVILNESIVSTKDAITFLTTEECVINEGESSTQVEVVCELVGSLSNVGANTISEMVTEYSINISVSNPNPAKGGMDEEEDDSLRERIIASPDGYPTGSRGWYQAVTNTIDNVHDSYCIQRPNGKLFATEIIFNCKDKSRVSETLSELNELFLSDRYDLLNEVILTPANNRLVFNENIIKVLIDKDSTFDVVCNEIITNVKDYFDNRNCGSEWDTDCIRFMIETIKGVVKVDISPSEKEECSVYEVFTTDYNNLLDRIVEVQL